MSRKKWLIGISIGLGVGLGVSMLFWPVKYWRILNKGTDAYEAHYALYGDRVETQEIKVENEIVKVGAVLVDLRQSRNLRPVEVTVRTSEGASLAEGEIVPEQIKDDELAWATLSNRVGSEYGKVIVEFKAPQSQVGNATGLRFEKASGHLALGLAERVTVLKRVIFWAQDYPEKAVRVGQVALGGCLVAGVLSLAGRKRKLGKLSVAGWLIIGLAMMALLLRIRTAAQVESVFGGDAFNYLIQSRAWLEGANPFAEEFRRKAPLLPLLLLPGWLGVIDPIVWGRIVSMIAATSAVVILPLLLIHLKVPRQLAIGAGLLLAVNRSFWWESVHGLANTLYAALILGAVYVFVQQSHKYGRYLVGVLAGLATLARWEGALVGAVMLPAVWVGQRLKIRTIIYTSWPALILVAIPWVFWPITGEVGMRTAGDIVGDAGLGLARSWGDFLGNWGGFELFLGRNWLLVETVGEQLLFLLAGLGLGVVVGLLQRKKFIWGGYLVRLVPYLLVLMVLTVVIVGDKEHYKTLAMLLTGLAGIGFGASLVVKPKLSVPVGLMLVGQVLVITLILPKSRYYLQLVPFLTVGVVLGILMLSDWQRSRVSRGGAVLALGILSMLVYTDSSLVMPGAVSDYNGKSSNHTVVMKASKYLLNWQGNVAVVEESDLPARLYLTLERTRIFPIEWASNMEDVTDDEVDGWLRDNDIKYLIETTGQPVFTIIKRRPDNFELVQKFGTKFAKTEALVYRVR